MRALRVAATAVFVLLLLSGGGTSVLAAAAPGSVDALEDASIAHVESAAGTLELLVSVPADSVVDLNSVTVDIGGVAVPATAERAETTTTVRRTAVLVIDTSLSMRGARFEAAKQAATSFLAALPSDVEVGIVSFASSARQLLAPTLDRAVARNVIEGLSLERKTHLYDAVLSAISLAGEGGQRTLLVLSDGADTSDTAIEEVVAVVGSSGVLLDAVSLDQGPGGARDALTALTDAAGGAVIDSDPESLSRAFTREADVLARQLVITAAVPADMEATEATVAVSLPTADGELTAEAFAPVQARTAPTATLPSASEPGLTVSRELMYVGLIGLTFGTVVLLVIALLPRREPELTPAERAAVYTDRLVGRGDKQSQRAEPDQALAQAKDAAAKVLARNSGLNAKIATRLESAGNPLKPAEWLLLHSAIFAGAGVMGLLLGRGNVVLALLFLGLGLFGPWAWLGIQRSRRRKAFDAGLPQTLQLMSGSLAAGLSLAQSVDTIVREGQEPMASEFKRVLIETRLGVSLEDAMEGVAERFASKDFAWVVMAIKIQRQVGGNLAELLDTVAATMREREYMRRQVAALAAEGKLSAWVLGGLPPGFMLYLLLTNRDYVIVMFQHPVGWAMLVGAGLLLTIGVFWMSRLTKVEV